MSPLCPPSAGHGLTSLRMRKGSTRRNRGRRAHTHLIWCGPGVHTIIGALADMEGIGRVGYLLDPDGNLFGLISPVLSDGSDARSSQV